MNQEHTARARFRSDYDDGRNRFLLAVKCRVLEVSFDALLDTGSQWCLLPTHIAERLGYVGTLDMADTRMSTRFGVLEGRLERISVQFLADEGEDAEVEATWFLSEDWAGPPVIGWKGCLERIRFALDPAEEWFYFAEP